MNTLTKITTADIQNAIRTNGLSISRYENSIEVDINNEAQLTITLDVAFDYEKDEAEIGYHGGWFVADFKVLDVVLFGYEEDEYLPINTAEIIEFINQCEITVE